MKIRSFAAWLGRVFLIIVLIGNILSTSGKPVSAASSLAPFSNCATQNQVPIEECDALVSLYNATDGANWSTNNGWLANNTVCMWYGVTCTAGSVSSLDLNGNQLTGYIPADLASLIHLKVLDLSWNQLGGGIPSELGSLSNLQKLTLSCNPLGGTIPTQLANLSQLSELYLDCDYLTGTIPGELGGLSSLTILDLQTNQLEGTIPQSWAICRNCLICTCMATG